MSILARAVIVVLLVAVPSPCISGKIVVEKIQFLNQSRKYYLFLPNGLSSEKMPLLITLHGSGRNGASLVEYWRELAQKEGIIVVGPDASNPAGWGAPADGPDLLRDIIEAVKSKYPIDARRVYLFGHSAGAVFALHMAGWESQYFAAAAIHAGAFRSEIESMAMIEAERKIPIAIFAGAADPLFPIGIVRRTRDSLQNAGFPVTLREISGHDHNYYVMASKVNKEAWNFLKANVLPQDPQYKQHHFDTGP